MDNILTTLAASCANNGIPILPTWYKYLDGTTNADGTCTLNFAFPGDLPEIALAVVEILLRVGALVAVAFVIYGGFLYLTSQGEPDRAATARKTIINAVVGLVITIIATGLVAFVGSQLL